MQQFAMTLQRRFLFQVASIVVACLAVGTVRTVLTFIPSYSVHVSALQLILFCLLTLTLVLIAIYFKQTQKSEARMRAMRRREAILRPCTTVLNVELYLVALAAVIAGFFNSIVFYLLLCFLVFILLVKFIFFLFCRRRIAVRGRCS